MIYAEQTYKRMTVFCIHIFNQKIFYVPTLHSYIFNTLHFIVGIERYKIIVGLTFAERSYIPYHTVATVPVEVQSVLIKCRLIAHKRNILDSEIGNPRHSDIIRDGIGDNHIVKFKIFNVKKVKHRSGITVKSEYISLCVEFSLIIAVPYPSPYSYVFRFCFCIGCKQKRR